MKAKLELASNILVISVALLLLYTYVSNYFRTISEVRPGDHLVLLRGVEWANHDHTLLLALRKGCSYCENSMPFYRRLAGLRKSHEIDAFITAVFPDDARAVESIAQTSGLDFPVIPNVPLKKIKVLGTPTVLLVNKQGVVERLWVGQLSPDAELDVLSALKPAHDKSQPKSTTDKSGHSVNRLALNAMWINVRVGGIDACQNWCSN